MDGWSSTNAAVAAALDPDPVLLGNAAFVGVWPSWIIDGSYIGNRTDSCMYGTEWRAALTTRAYEATWSRVRGGGRMAVCTFR